MTSEGSNDPGHTIDLVALDATVRRMRTTAAAFDWDCSAVVEAIDALPPDGQCEVLQTTFRQVRNAVITLQNTIGVLGGNVMTHLNVVAMHIAQDHMVQPDETLPVKVVMTDGETKDPEDMN